MLRDGGDRDGAADGFGPRDGELHKADCRLHEKTRQIDRIADGHGFYEEKLEERGREISMEVAAVSGVRPLPGAFSSNRKVRRRFATSARVYRAGSSAQSRRASSSPLKRRRRSLRSVSIDSFPIPPAPVTIAPIGRP